MARQVLLVEDLPQDVELTREAFSQARRSEDLVVADCGEAALDYLHRRGAYQDRSGWEDPSLILLDLGLPGISGLDVLAQIKRDPETRHIPVVVVTVSDTPEARASSYDQGTNAFVTKPRSEREFLDMISALAMFWLDTSRLPGGQRRREV